MSEQDHTLSAILRKWPLVLVSVVVFAGLFAFAATLIPPTYTGSTKILYGRASSSLLSGESASGADVQRALATQAEIVIGDQVMGEAAADLGMPQRELVAATTVDDLPGSNILSISVTADNAEEAARRAQRVGEGYVSLRTDQARAELADQSEALQASIEDLRAQLEDLGSDPGSSAAADGTSTALAALVERQIQLSAAAEAEQGVAEVISQAQVPRSTSSPTPVTGGILGAVVGLILGTGAALLVSRSQRSRAARRQRQNAGQVDDAETVRSGNAV